MRVVVSIAVLIVISVMVFLFFQSEPNDMRMVHDNKLLYQSPMVSQQSVPLNLRKKRMPPQMHPSPAFTKTNLPPHASLVRQGKTPMDQLRVSQSPVSGGGNIIHLDDSYYAE